MRSTPPNATPSGDDPIPHYEDALAWLYAQRRAGPRDPERTRRLLAALQIRLAAPAVHVVGTVGKGTVTAMVERGLRATGAVTGRFVSPHVESFRERIETSGVPIDPLEVVSFVDRVRRAALRPAPAFFEITYAMALDLFARRGVTIAVVEAGVGARGDATSTLDHVVATVITNASMDHAPALGGTVAAIAREKAAAVRPGVPVVTGTTGVARAIVAARAASLASRLHADPPGGSAFELPPEHAATEDVARLQNQRLAAATLRILGAPEDAVVEGITAPPLPARRERFVIDGRNVILDGAHNPAASAVLAESLAGPVVLVFGAMGRKDGLRTFQQLERRATRVVLTEAAEGEGVPPGIGAQAVSQAGAQAGAYPVYADPLAALQWALAACPAGGTVVVAGSMYLAGRLRAFLREVDEAAPAVPNRG